MTVERGREIARQRHPHAVVGDEPADGHADVEPAPVWPEPPTTDRPTADRRADGQADAAQLRRRLRDRTRQRRKDTA